VEGFFFLSAFGRDPQVYLREKVAAKGNHSLMSHLVPSVDGKGVSPVIRGCSVARLGACRPKGTPVGSRPADWRRATKGLKPG